MTASLTDHIQAHLDLSRIDQLGRVSRFAMLESDDEEAEVKVPEASMSRAISEGLVSLDTVDMGPLFSLR